MTRKSHTCDDRCTCPIHGTPLYYAPSIDDHACQDIDCQHGHGMRQTLFTSVADAPRAMLGVEADPMVNSRVQVQGSPWLPAGMGVLVDPRFLPRWPAERPDPLMSGDVMDLDANTAYWQPE